MAPPTHDLATRLRENTQGASDEAAAPPHSMKKLLPIVLVFSLAVPLLLWLLGALRLRPDLPELAQNVGVAVGWSMVFVGLVAMTLGACLSSDKQKIYQGGFCVLLGVAISTFSLPAFVAALALAAWVDHKGRSIL